MIPSPHSFRIRLLALFAGLALIASSALAVHNIAIIDDTVPYGDDDDIGVDLGLDEENRLQLILTGEGDGTLGDIAWPDAIDPDDLPEDAAGNVVASEARLRLGIVEDLDSGIAFVIDDVTRPNAMHATMERLQQIGCDIGDLLPASFEFQCNGDPLRAVFGTTDAGVRVYLGE